MADFDGDGRLDLYTGCFEGGMYVMAGKGAGAFARPAPLLDKSGGVLRIGKYWDDAWKPTPSSNFPDELGIGGAAVDWDADGDLDLILGSYEGRMFLRRNLGTAKAHAFALENEQLEAGGQPLEVESRHAMPTVADWDGDGLWDLLSGSDSGAVYWWRNVGAKGAPKLSAPLELVAKSSKAADGVGTRTQVNACDFDADGRLDLLVGDYHGGSGGKGGHHGYVWLFRRLPAPEIRRL